MDKMSENEDKNMDMKKSTQMDDESKMNQEKIEDPNMKKGSEKEMEGKGGSCCGSEGKTEGPNMKDLGEDQNKSQDEGKVYDL